MSDDVLPSVDECPVLADAVGEMKLDLAVNDDGEIYLFHEKPFNEAVNWVEYSEVEQKIYLVTQEGRIQGLGMKVPKLIGGKIDQSIRIFLVHVENGAPKTIWEMPFIKHI